MTSEEKDIAIRKEIDVRMFSFMLLVDSFVKECCKDIKSVDLKDKLDCYFYITKNIYKDKKQLYTSIYNTAYNHLYNSKDIKIQVDCNSVATKVFDDIIADIKSKIKEKANDFNSQDQKEIPKYKLEDFESNILTLYSQKHLVDYHLIDDCNFINKEIVSLINQYFPNTIYNLEEDEVSKRKADFAKRLNQFGNSIIKSIIELNVQLVDTTIPFEWSLEKEQIRQANIINALKDEAKKIFDSYSAVIHYE